jgi:hypothetical protein
MSNNQLNHRHHITHNDRTRRDESEALEVLRSVNRELLVCAGANVLDAVEKECDLARDHVLNAIRILFPLTVGSTPPPEELSVAQFRQAAEKRAADFADWLKLAALLGGNAKWQLEPAL